MPATLSPSGTSEGDIHMRVNCRMLVDEHAQVDTIAFGYLTFGSVTDVDYSAKRRSDNGSWWFQR